MGGSITSGLGGGGGGGGGGGEGGAIKLAWRHVMSVISTILQPMGVIFVCHFDRFTKLPRVRPIYLLLIFVCRLCILASSR